MRRWDGLDIYEVVLAVIIIGLFIYGLVTGFNPPPPAPPPGPSIPTAG